MSGTMMTLGILLRLHDQVSGKLTGIKQQLGGLAGVSDKMIKVGTALSGVGFAAAGASAKVRGILSDAFAGAAEIDALAQKLRTIPGITEDQVGRAIAAARTWATTYGQSAGEYIDSFYETAGSLGVDKFKESIAATENAMRVARASFGATGDAAKTLTQLFSNYGGSIEAMADKLVHTQNAFQISNLSQLTSGLQNSAAQALAFRVELDQVLAVVGRLNDKGMTNERAGTALSAALRELPDASKRLQFDIGKNAQGGVDFVATLANITAKYGDLNKLTNEQRLAFQKAFGDEGMRAVQLLSAEVDVLRAKQKELAGADARNVATKAFDTVTQGANVQLRVLDQQIADMKAEIGKDFIPILKDLLPVMRDVLKSIADFAKENPELTKWGLAIGALAAPVASLAGGALTLGGGALKLADHFHVFEKLSGLNFASLSGVGPALKSFGEKAAKALKGAGGAISGVMKGHPILAAILLAGTAAVVVYTYWDDIVAAARKAMTAVADAFAGAGKAIRDTVRDWARLGGDLIDGLIAGIKARLTKLMDGAGKLAKGVLAELRDAFDTHSPSRETWKIGEDVADGLIGGLLARAAARDAEITALAKGIAGGIRAGAAEVVPVEPAGMRRDRLGRIIASQDIEDLDRVQQQYGSVAAAASRSLSAAGRLADNLRNTWERAFKDMEDAMVSFARTGKLNFKSLANSLIADLARIQIQEGITKPMARALSGINWGSLKFWADGGVPGGPSVSAWRNQIVNHPTLFAFARGGVMGEAGPEAIMPLRRDGSGRLGVDASGGNVQVNVQVANNVAEAAQVRVRQHQGPQGAQVEISIDRIEAGVARNIAAGRGPLAAVLQRRFGLNPAAGAV